ncbi:MAG TPA: phosphoribosylamine--glycine ligase [Polyangia bacterium]|nr:phosphoribosylamine--glycine ligase [Polyangia bacterium]
MGARVLIIGGGGREHALAWRLRRSPSVSEILCAPGNAGIASEATCVAVGADDLPGLVALAQERRPDLVVVGPEGPLCAGLADRLADAGIRVFGPSRAAAEIEGSKVFAKQLMQAAGVPTADFFVAHTFEDATAYIDAHPGPLVVKADGLAGGKGVLLCQDADHARKAARSILSEHAFGAAGARIVIEQRLSGREASLMALCDGERVVLLPSAEDHKAAYDGDRGPNTGGMGAYSPTPLCDAALAERVRVSVIEKIVSALAASGRPYRGVLYAGLMLTPDRGPMVLEFNCRFGDPEAQVVLARFADDLYPWLLGVAVGRMPEGLPCLDARAAVCVVKAAGGYPGSYQKGIEIQGLDDAASLPDVMLFHAGTARDARGRLVTAGGRVVGTTALGESVAAARTRAYEAVARIHFRGQHHRTDIAARDS